MKRIIWSLLVIFAAVSCQAQDWAKANLQKSSRHQEWVKVKQGNRDVECFVVYPEVKEKATAIVVIHENKGLSDWVRSLADQLAAAGYIAIAPDLLSGTGPNGGKTSDYPNEDAATQGIYKLPADQVSADIDAVAAHILKDPACNGKLATVGFCWGGGQSFAFPTRNASAKAALVFYGTPPPTAAMAKINCPIYGFYGGMDNRIDSTIPKAQADMKAAGKTYEPVTYEGAGHGFMRGGEAPDAKPADKKARDDSWVRLKEILKKL